MFNLISLNLRSLWARKVSFILTTLSLSLSICFYFTIQELNYSARNSFMDSISKTDLIVGEKTGAINLLLYTVFHRGSSLNSVKYTDYLEISNHPQISWTIPISLGDSYGDHRVIGTNLNFFNHYQYGGDLKIEFSNGRPFQTINEIVIGHLVAKKNKLNIGDKIYISHGIGQGLEESKHDKIFFTITGIIKQTATPIDNAVYLSLESLEAIHDEEYSSDKNYTPQIISSFLVGAKSRIHTMFIQNYINNFKNAPLSAIIPGVVLSSIWELVGQAQTVLTIVSLAVLFISFICLMLNLYSQLNERRREMAIFRSQGMSIQGVWALFIMEALLVSTISYIVGHIFKIFLILISKNALFEFFALNIYPSFNLESFLKTYMIYLFSAFIVSLIPAYSAYKKSLADGLTLKF